MNSPGNGNGGYVVAVWSTAAWRAEAVRWLDARLGGAGIERAGEVAQPRVRPWSTLLTTPTTHGRVWLKATSPTTSFEVRVYEIFAHAGVGHVLDPIALDTARGWLLLPDGGAVLADHLPDGDIPAALARILPCYGQIQRRLTPHVEALLAAGVDDMRADRMPARFDQALAYVEDIVRRNGTASDRVICRGLHAFRPAFVAWCGQLAAMPVPPSLEHNDLHPHNVLMASRGGDPTFFDWGDAVVAHPFASMLMTLDFARQRLNVDLDDPSLRRIRDAYLSAFDDMAPHAELVDTLALACRVAKVARVLTWQRAVESMDAAGRFARMPLESLAAVLDDSYLSGGCPPPGCSPASARHRPCRTTWSSPGSSVCGLRAIASPTSPTAMRGSPSQRASTTASFVSPESAAKWTIARGYG